VLTPDYVVSLLDDLQARQGYIHENDRFYSARNPLSFLNADQRKALGDRLPRLATNLCRLSVQSIAERTKIVAFSGADIDAEWQRLDMDAVAASAIKDALLHGESYLIAWVDSTGRPLITAESPKHVVVQRDPETREVVAACKKWVTKTETWVVIYLPDRIEKWASPTTNAVTTDYSLRETLPNPLGTVNVTALTNEDRVGEPGHSEIEDLKVIQEALSAVLADMMVSSAYSGRERAWVSGVDAVEEPVIDEDGNVVLGDDGEPMTRAVNPYPPENAMMLASDPSARFGTLTATSLSSYEAAVRILMQQAQAVSALPAHYLGLTQMGGSVSSAESLRAAEQSLTARSSEKQLVFSRGFERLARLIVAIRDSVDPDTVTARIRWSDPSSRSLASEADWSVKMYSAGLLPRRAVLEKLGYDAAEVDSMLTELEHDATISKDLQLGRYLTGQTDPS
jgi:hypothetical protein